MPSCAIKRCSNPACGPCTIYDRFPMLRSYEAAQAERKAVRKAARDGVFDPVSQSLAVARSRRRQGPKDIRRGIVY